MKKSLVLFVPALLLFALPALAHEESSPMPASAHEEAKAAPASWPFGFFSETVVKTRFLITDLEFAPDGSIWLLSQNGKLYKFDGLLSEPMLTLSVSSDKERGLLGLAFDPAFTRNGYIYLYYTTGQGALNYAGQPKNRVSRFQFDPASGTVGNETIILDGIGSDSGMHNAGGIKIGPDGKLYIPTGEGGRRSQNSQELTNLSGKILRVNLDGSVPTDNPFVGRKGVRGEIWAYGLRNPWRITFDAKTGSLYAADVGGGLAEEVNLILRGKNYGWPQTEGFKPAGSKGVTYPIYAYGHSKKGASIIGGDVYYSPAGAGDTPTISRLVFPKKYHGRYFFGDFVTYQISTVDLAAKKPVAELLFPDMGGVIDINVGPDGALYLAVGDSPFTGHVEKVYYTGKFNPAATKIKAVASKNYGKLPLVVDFSMAGRPDSSKLKFKWNFGDSSSATGEKIRHVYKKSGKFQAALELVYEGKVVATDSVEIFAGNLPPKLTVTSNLKGKYKAGDIIKFTGRAVDPEDGPIAPDGLIWQVGLGHGEHEHPFLDGIVGPNLTIAAPTDGEADANVGLMVMLKAEDSQGLKSEQHYEVLPQAVRVKLLANVKGVEFMLDGKPVKAPYSFANVVNFPRQLEAPDTVTVGGKVYKFKKWSSSGERVLKLVPTKNVVLEANFTLVK